MNRNEYTYIINRKNDLANDYHKLVSEYLELVRSKDKNSIDYYDRLKKLDNKIDLLVAKLEIYDDILRVCSYNIKYKMKGELD